MELKNEFIKYLASRDKPLYFEINNIVLDNHHPQRENLFSFMQNINDEELCKTLSNEDYKSFGKQIESLSWEDNAKISIAKSKLFKEVGELRIQTLLDDNLNPPPPYDLPEFKNIEIDSNGLISLSKLRELNKTSNKIFQILLSLPQTNSMYWCIRYLLEISIICDIKLRLDPYLIFNKDGYCQMNYKMFIYGEPPNMYEYNSLKEINHLKWMSDNHDESDIQFTDAVWIPKGNEIHIIIEEIPKVECNYYRGSRYFHTIYNKTSNKIEHFDGAIRIYSKDEIKMRKDLHVKDIGKIGKRIKIFQIDSEIEIEKWSNVAASFFVWNSDVIKYFSS